MSGIIETNLQFRDGLHPRSATRRTVCHHADTNGDVGAETIHLWHLAKNPPWAGIGYHFVIRMNGAIERGRPIEMVGAHAGANGNPDSIGICFAGRFISKSPTPEQIMSYIWLHRYLEGIYGSLEVNKHNDFMATTCPGPMFPIDKIKELLEGGAGVGESEQWKEDLVTYLLDQGLITERRDPEATLTWWELGAVIKRLKGEA